MIYKICEHCGKTFEAKRKNRRFCCSNCQKRSWEESNKEKVLDSVNKYRTKAQERIKQHNIKAVINNPQYYLWRNIRYRANKKDIPFNIDPEDIIIPEVCPVLKIPLEFKVGTNKGGANQNSPSVDRIIPELGYTKGNIRVISYKANRLKSDSNIEELELILGDLKRLAC